MDRGEPSSSLIQETNLSVEKQMEDLFHDSEEPFQESGSEYLPSKSSSPSLIELTELLGDENIPPVLENAQEVEPQKKTRKRKREPKKWKKNVRKDNRAKGKQYINTKGKTIPQKEIDVDQPCPCVEKCHTKISPSQQKELFQKFYELGTFDLQTSYLFSLINVTPKLRQSHAINQTESSTSRRSNTRVYKVANSDGVPTKVCKEFFKKIFQVSDGRITRLLKNKLSVSTPPQDQRGRHIPKNKTSDDQVQNVKSFIEKFPTYESHYTLHKSSARLFLPPELNITKMYSLYCEQSATPLSYYMFTKIFNENFNLSFHPPISDSCKRFDMLNIKMQACDNEEEKSHLETQRKLHLLKADSARNNYNKDKEEAKVNGNTTVLVFDLMKTLPTPIISTGICYYKRQLWTYCLGIHDAATDKVTMCLWDETIASRGPQEIGSCLLRYIKENVTTKKLILYSDQCGGQNRNIKMAVLCQYITAHPDFVVESIDHKFFLSGHSYLACDQDFGLIEKKKKLFKNIFVPDDWDEVIKAARKKEPFVVIKMKKEHFFSTKRLEMNITNRKITSEGSKVKWLSIQWLKYHQMHKHKIFFKYSNNEDVIFEYVDLSKRNTTDITELELLYPDGKAISKEKKKDLLDLLDYIPPIHHQFYTSIKVSPTISNTIHLTQENNDSDSD
ncbi:unnamed protein product [Colias eurytheme]|nr:unnamed protein product [Colias eurytheme]